MICLWHRYAAAVPPLIVLLPLLGCQQAGLVELPQRFRINGEIPPGRVTSAARVELLARLPVDNGQEMLTYRTTRIPGTRAPIHSHQYGGITCLLQGESTMRVKGKPPMTHQEGDCYPMPSGVPMVNLNSGKGKFVTLDFFQVPKGAPVWHILEPGTEAISNQFDAPAADSKSPPHL